MWNVGLLKRFLEWIKTTSWCSTLAIGGKDGGRLEFDFEEHTTTIFSYVNQNIFLFHLELH